MFKHYLLIAIRNIKRSKLNTIINISGFSIGIAITILILSYVWFELSFDRFHSKFDQTYRVVIAFQNNGETVNRATVGPALATTLKDEFPEIDVVARMFGNIWLSKVVYKDKEIPVERAGIVTVDPDVLKIFDIQLVQGDIETGLRENNSVIIIEEEAEKLFGNENPIGEFIEIKVPANETEHSYKVTGIAKAMPANSHFSFKYLVSSIPYFNGYGGFEFPYTNIYITLPPGYPPEQLENKFPGMVRRHVAPEIENRMNISYDEYLRSGNYWHVKLLPLKKVHLDNTYIEQNNANASIIKKGKLFQVRMYIIVAVLIILLACINFITLSTAKSEARAKEVGIRKVTGAKRNQLIRQFLAESLLLCIISLVIAVLLVLLFSTPINNLLGIQTANNTDGKIFIILFLLFITLLAGVLAGSYPAFFLSAFRPASVLYSRLNSKMKGMNTRNGLVVVQFVISIVLIIASIVVYKQYHYMQNKDLGFDKENIVIIKNLNENYFRKDSVFLKQYTSHILILKQEILKNPKVIDATLTGVFPGNWGVWGSGQGFWPVSAEGSDVGKFIRLFSTNVDYSYINVFGLELAAGSNFNEMNTIPKNWEGVLINETAAKLLGLKDPVGKYVYPKDFYQEGEKSRMILSGVPVAGVIKDFHNQDLYGVINPYIFFPICELDYDINYLSVKFMPGNIPENISFLKETWENIVPNYPFEFSFFDQEFEHLYIKEKKLARIFTFFCILAVFIGCLGMFGLAVLTTEQRTKEIGIRKVNGASITKITLLIVQNFALLVFIALVIAMPVAWIIMHKWLESFLFKTNLSWWIFILAGFMAFGIALLTVSWQSWRAATRNPVESLRYE